MLPLTMLGTDLAILLVDTTRVWWRLLPKILTIWLVGWLGYQVTLKVAILAGDLSAWLSLVIFSFGFVFKLSAIVLILRLVGAELHVRELIPEDEYEDDGREGSIARLLALTLLPFLGIYTAFGQVQDAAGQLQIESKFQAGGVLSTSDITSRLNVDSGSAKHYLTVTAVVVGAYILRRLLDKVHEETGWRPLGFVVVLVEGFFVLSALIVGGGAVSRLLSWLDDRVFVGWLAAVGHAIGSVWSAFVAVLPGPLVSVVGAIRDGFWPVLTQVISQPIIWLAVAALVYGSNVISVAELWRKGRPLASRVRVARRVMERRAGRAEVRAVRQENGRAAFVREEFKEAFLGDIDDKYLPTIHSLRLILRAGIVFLGAYLLVYNGWQIATNYWQTAVDRVAGGHPVTFWSTFGPLLDLVTDLPTEPWRICLLAVALQRALEIFRSRAIALGTLHPDGDRSRTAEAVANERFGDRLPAGERGPA